MRYVCASCHTILPLACESHSGEVTCPACALVFRIGVRSITYNSDNLLKQLGHHAYLQWKVLNNNGYLSYQWLQSGSISLSNRPDVIRFKRFIESELKRGVLLDVGCGTLEVPGYLDFNDKAGIEFFGLDPIGESAFWGQRIVGCSEFMPFPNASIDTIVFATSLDHVCSLDKTISEVSRLLKTNGRIIVWMSDRSHDFMLRLKLRVMNLFRRLIHGFALDRYREFENSVVLYVPPGAVDPFHAYYEDPEIIINEMKKKHLVLVKTEHNSDNEVFMSFAKC